MQSAYGPVAVTLIVNTSDKSFLVGDVVVLPVQTFDDILIRACGLKATAQVTIEGKVYAQHQQLSCALPFRQQDNVPSPIYHGRNSPSSPGSSSSDHDRPEDNSVTPAPLNGLPHATGLPKIEFTVQGKIAQCAALGCGHLFQQSSSRRACQPCLTEGLKVSAARILVREENVQEDLLTDLHNWKFDCNKQTWKFIVFPTEAAARMAEERARAAKMPFKRAHPSFDYVLTTKSHFWRMTVTAKAGHVLDTSVKPEPGGNGSADMDTMETKISEIKSSSVTNHSKASNDPLTVVTFMPPEGVFQKSGTRVKTGPCRKRARTEMSGVKVKRDGGGGHKKSSSGSSSNEDSPVQEPKAATSSLFTLQGPTQPMQLSGSQQTQSTSYMDQSSHPQLSSGYLFNQTAANLGLAGLQKPPQLQQFGVSNNNSNTSMMNGHGTTGTQYSGFMQSASLGQVPVQALSYPSLSMQHVQQASIVSQQQQQQHQQLSGQPRQFDGFSHQSMSTLSGTSFPSQFKQVQQQHSNGIGSQMPQLGMTSQQQMQSSSNGMFIPDYTSATLISSGPSQTGFTTGHSFSQSSASSGYTSLNNNHSNSHSNGSSGADQVSVSEASHMLLSNHQAVDAKLTITRQYPGHDGHTVEHHPVVIVYGAPGYKPHKGANLGNHHGHHSRNNSHGGGNGHGNNGNNGHDHNGSSGSGNGNGNGQYGGSGNSGGFSGFAVEPGFNMGGEFMQAGLHAASISAHLGDSKQVTSAPASTSPAEIELQPTNSRNASASAAAPASTGIQINSDKDKDKGTRAAMPVKAADANSPNSTSATPKPSNPTSASSGDGGDRKNNNNDNNNNDGNKQDPDTVSQRRLSHVSSAPDEDEDDMSMEKYKRKVASRMSRHPLLFWASTLLGTFALVIVTANILTATDSRDGYLFSLVVPAIDNRALDTYVSTSDKTMEHMLTQFSTTSTLFRPWAIVNNLTLPDSKYNLSDPMQRERIMNAVEMTRTIGLVLGQYYWEYRRNPRTEVDIFCEQMESDVLSAWLTCFVCKPQFNTRLPTELCARAAAYKGDHHEVCLALLPVAFNTTYYKSYSSSLLQRHLELETLEASSVSSSVQTIDSTREAHLQSPPMTFRVDGVWLTFLVLGALAMPQLFAVGAVAVYSTGNWLASKRRNRGRANSDSVAGNAAV